MLNVRLSACVSTVLAAMPSLFTSAASIRLVLGIKGPLRCSLSCKTNADYIKPHPPKSAQKIGKSSKTRTRAGKVGAQQLPHFPKILYHQRCAIQRRLPRVAPCRVAGVTTKIIRSAGFLKAGHSVVRVQSRGSVLTG